MNWNTAIEDGRRKTESVFRVLKPLAWLGWHTSALLLFYMTVPMAVEQYEFSSALEKNLFLWLSIIVVYGWMAHVLSTKIVMTGGSE